jgi:hypothetical protein
MTPGLRKVTLTAHIVCSLGWLGAVVAYLPLALTGLSSPDTEKVRAAYLAMELIGWCVLVPLSLAALLTGLVQALGTEWGLFRHYWVRAKFVLTIGATTVLLLHMPAVSRMVAGGFELPRAQFVVQAAGGLAVLPAVTILSIFKPWGPTAYGPRQKMLVLT